ncbi:MAG: hypothetical protein ACHREM_09800 [Polyangiales bacterium]
MKVMNVLLTRAGAGTLRYEEPITLAVHYIQATKIAIEQAADLLAGADRVACEFTIRDGVVVDVIEALPETARESLHD